MRNSVRSRNLLPFIRYTKLGRDLGIHSKVPGSNHVVGFHHIQSLSGFVCNTHSTVHSVLQLLCWTALGRYLSERRSRHSTLQQWPPSFEIRRCRWTTCCSPIYQALPHIAFSVPIRTQLDNFKVLHRHYRLQSREMA